MVCLGLLPPLLLLLGSGPRAAAGAAEPPPNPAPGSAPAKLPESCTPPLHQCLRYNRVTCFLPEAVCDGEQHCEDGSDERGCTSCKGTSVLCEGRCVYRCDGVADCEDQFDEDHCTDCMAGAVLCDGRCARRCIYPGQRDCIGVCNGVRECADNGDEQHCGRCGPGAEDLSCGVRVEPRVLGTPRTFSSLTCGRECDGVRQCANGWDESRCPADAGFQSQWRGYP